MKSPLAENKTTNTYTISMSTGPAEHYPELDEYKVVSVNRGDTESVVDLEALFEEAGKKDRKRNRIIYASYGGGRRDGHLLYRTQKGPVEFTEEDVFDLGLDKKEEKE